MSENNLLINLKVLYVEDDEETREQMQYFLKRRVGKLFTAKDGEEGFQKYCENKPDIIITDLRMPKVDGIEMSRKIRKIDKKPSIIITTAFSDVETVLLAVDIGVDKYVLKPIDTKELLKAMEESALKLFNGEENTLIIGDKIVDINSKRDLESKIQNRIALFIKNKTGKGPKNVKAFIKGNLIEIEAYDTLTKYEKTLLEHSKNEHLVSFSREALYLNRDKEIEKIISEIIEVQCILENIAIDLGNDKDKLVISIK
ncbi:Na-translocating system protein MpsC family protein [Clostridium sp. DL1XJH146]